MRILLVSTLALLLFSPAIFAQEEQVAMLIEDTPTIVGGEQAESLPSLADGCVPVEVEYLSNSVETLMTGTFTAVVFLVLLVELLRWLIKPLRRKKGVSLPEWGRGGIAGICFIFGQILAFAGIAPAVREGAIATFMAGLTVTSLAVLFNETIFAWIRGFLEKKFGSTEEAPEAKKKGH